MGLGLVFGVSGRLVIITIIIIFLPQVVLIPGVKNYKLKANITGGYYYYYYYYKLWTDYSDA